MEQYFYYGSANEVPRYDCKSNNFTAEELESRGYRNPVLGAAFIFYGVLAEVCYVLAMMAMFRRDLRRHSCYKIMIILGSLIVPMLNKYSLGIYDMLAIGVNSILTGYFWIIGAWYCTHPELIFISGALGLGLWCGACMNCFILVLNRLIDLWKPHIMNSLFGGNKTYTILLLPFFYSVYFTLFTPPLIFNSTATAWFFDPFIDSVEGESFYNYPHTANNLLIVVATCVLYTFVVVVLMKKWGKGGGGAGRGISKGQISIIIQSTAICMANLIAALVYVYMQFFPTPSWLVLFGHMSWQAGHGIPAFVYLLMNKTIQYELGRYFCKKAIHHPGSYKIGDTSTLTRSVTTIF